MAKVHPYRVVDVDFVNDAPIRFDSHVDLDCTPERLFEIFEDPVAWTVWADAIESVEWTSPKPFGVGTTRTVGLAGNQVADEVFIAWEHGKRMSFCFTQASFSAFRAFVEDYNVTDLGNGKCHLQWTFAADPKPLHRVILTVLGPVMKFFLNSLMRSLSKYVDANP